MGSVARAGWLVCLLGVLVAGPVGVGRAAVLPDGRAFELVSPPLKGGGAVVADTQRTRAAGDGSAVGFAGLTAFGDPLGTGVATDYMAVRDPQGTVGAGSGWSTHAITPLQSGATYDGVLSALEPLYVGEFTSDLNGGVFAAESPLTSDPYTAGVPNFYLRSDLRTPGTGSYALITACPFCESRGRALPGLQLVQSGVPASWMRPFWAGMSPDGAHVAFESRQPLTADAPTLLTAVKLYEWDQGTVRLAGRVPPTGSIACDDVTQAPACVASGTSIAGGEGAGAHAGLYELVAHDVSDGSDGHSRVFFTRPTQADGVTLNPTALAGQLFMRTDGSSTVQVNVSERMVPGTSTPDPDTTTPATYLDASADGQRVFFMTNQALTTDAPADGLPKLYMYDASRPGGSHLTFLSPDNEPADGDGGIAIGMVGTSADGHYVYFIADGQLVSGQPLLGPDPGIYVWHEGTLRYVGPAPTDSFVNELRSSGTDPVLAPRQAQVTPDGRHLLFSAESGVGLGGYDQGHCLGGGDGCRELYVYSADTGALACASCNPSGAPATAMATDQVRTINGASQSSVHENEAITDDGSRVFFSTAEALVPEDVNGRSDAYEYDVATRTVHLLSTGTSTQDSWFMDASSTGDDAFFATSQPLVGWDSDQAYDLYDARVNGGWPEPPPPPIDCAGDACQPVTTTPPLTQPNASSAFSGPGNLNQTLKARPKPKPALRCRKGLVKKRVRGKDKCVKRPRPKTKARGASHAQTAAPRGRA